MTGPVVVKLGGDALASPQRIVAQARRLAARARAGPVVAVASARRGVTDHLLQLTAEVAGLAPDSSPEAGAAEADRALASGEVVAAALLALALNRLGTPAVSLDAREAGVRTRGPFGAARIAAIEAGRIRRILAAGLVPVVTGFQGWQRGRVATIGRGGTDASAVALARALRADRVVLVKEAAGLRTGDPKLIPDAGVIHAAPHDFLTRLATAGSKILQAEAARLAERRALPLEFWSLDGERPDTLIRDDVSATGLLALATPAGLEPGPITVVAGGRDALPGRERIATALSEADVAGVQLEAVTLGWRITVAPGCYVAALRALHRGLVQDVQPFPARRAS